MLIGRGDREGGERGRVREGGGMKTIDGETRRRRLRSRTKKSMVNAEACLTSDQHKRKATAVAIIQ